jgi:putative ABC transport system substrate-binding protein
VRRRRIALGLALALGLVVATPRAEAQRPPKVPRIGVLWTVAESPGAPLREALEQGLRDLGYVEGKTIVLEHRWAEGRPERLPQLAADLVRLKADIIVAGITAAAQAARNATGTIPIVMAVVPDPVGSGLVASLARPGGNVTGLSLLAVDLAGKQLELLKAAVPSLTRVAVFQNPGLPAHPPMLKGIETAAGTLGVKVQALEVRAAEEVERAFAAMTRERAGALVVLPDPVFYNHRVRVAELAAKHRLPAMYGIAEHAEVGGLMAYAADLRENWRRAATYVDKILKGARPADLPVQQPTRMEFVINLRTARALGLAIPPSVLLRADRVIE